MDFYEAIDACRDAMVDKFRARDAKQGDRSVLRRHILDCDMLSIAVHCDEELRELESEPHDKGEMIDVMNMHFLRWWWEMESQPPAAGSETP